MLLGERYQHFATDTGFAYPVDSPVIWDPTKKDHALTPQLGVVWLPRPNFSLYASFSKNFGSNNGVDFQGSALDPESGKQLELGTKLELFDSRLTASLAWYDLRKTNVAVPDLAHPNFSLTVGEIRSRGTELNVQGEPAPGWKVLFSAAHDPTLITRGGPVGSNCVQGDPLSGTPKWMTNLWSTYQFQGRLLQGWKFGFGVNWRDGTEYPRSRLDGTALTTPSYWLASAMASYERAVGTSKVAVQLNVENLFNTFYFTNLYPVAASNYSYLNYSTPRSLMASVKVSF